MKKLLAILLTCLLTAAVLTGCRRAPASSDTGSGGTNSGEKVSITMLNSKGEIQEALERVAAEYEKITGVHLEIIASGAGDVPYTKITGMYNSGTAPTMAMLDTTDIIALAEEKALDLTAEKWTAECADSLIKVNDKVYAFPFCIEGRGLIYNEAAIEDTLGVEFDPDAIDSYDALKGLLEQLRAKGMEYPVIISKEDWSVGAHLLGMVYDTYDGTTAGSETLINGLKDGSIHMAEVERYNQFIATFDLLREYNINHADPLGALYEQDPIYLADGRAAIWFNGNWAWPNLAEADASTDDDYGFMPFVLGNDTEDFANEGIQASPSKWVMIDRVQASEAQQQAAKDFLNWLVYDTQGQKLLVEECDIIPACKNNPNKATDPLSADIQERVADGETFGSSFVAPGDHWSVLGAEMQKYLAGQQDKAQLAAAIDAYWQKQG